MDHLRLETNRLILRNFEEKDLPSLYLLLADQEVNTFLPWYPVKDMEETECFYEKRLKNKKYCFAICLRDDGARLAMCMQKKMTATTSVMRSVRNTGARGSPARQAARLLRC